MRFGTYVLALSMTLCPALVLAQDEPAKDQPPKEPAAEEKAPAKDDAAKQDTEKKDAEKAAEGKAPEAEAAPAKEAAPAAAAAPAAEPAPAKEHAAKAEEPKAAAPAKKELSACAKTYVPLADTYKAAYEDMEKWIDQINTQTTAASDKVAKLQAQIQENETATTQAKLAGDNAKVKDLTKQNKALWNDMNAAKKGLADTCAQFGKEAAARVKKYDAATEQALSALKK